MRLSVAERQIRELMKRNQTRAARHETARRRADFLENQRRFFAFDQAWNFTCVNAQAEKAFGTARAELIRRNIWAEISRADRIDL